MQNPAFFMYKQVIDMLKTKYKKHGLSYQVLSGVAEQIVEQIDGDATKIEAAVDSYANMFNAMQSDLDRLRQEGAKPKGDAEAKPEEGKDGNNDAAGAKPDAQKPGAGATVTDPRIDQLLTAVAGLTKVVGSLSESQTADKRRAKFDALTTDWTDEANKTKAGKYFDAKLASVKTDDELAELLDEIKNDWGATEQQSRETDIAGGFMPPRKADNGDKRENTVSPGMQRLLDARKAEAAKSAQAAGGAPAFQHTAH